MTPPENSSQVSYVYPKVFENLKAPDENKVIMGKDINQKVMEDVHYALHQVDNLPAYEKTMKVRETDLYIKSIARMQSNQYAVAFKKEEKIEENREKEYLENVTVPKRVRKRYSRFLGVDLEDFQNLSTEEKRAVKRKMLDLENDSLLEIEAYAHEKKYKVGWKKFITLSVKNEFDRKKGLKDLRNEIINKRISISEDPSKNVDADLVVGELHIDDSVTEVDTTVPTVFQKNDLRDDRSNPWTSQTALKRTLIYSGFFVVVGLMLRVCYTDYKEPSYFIKF